MPSKYKYEDAYKEYESFSLLNEFREAEQYLLYDEQHANHEVFSAVDEIYHWFCVKQHEVENLLKIDEMLKGKIFADKDWEEYLSIREKFNIAFNDAISAIDRGGVQSKGNYDALYEMDEAFTELKDLFYHALTCRETSAREMSSRV